LKIYNSFKRLLLILERFLWKNEKKSDPVGIIPKRKHHETTKWILKREREEEGKRK